MIVVDVVLCSSCRSLDDRPVTTFALSVEIRLASPAVARVRRGAGSTRLCEPCWIRLTGAVPRVAAKSSAAA